MANHPPAPVSPTRWAIPRIPTFLLRALLPRAERDEVLADLNDEFLSRAAAAGPRAARRWIWRQALYSAPALVGWSSRRELTGFEPPANSYRPGVSMLKTFLADARYAARRLRSRPGYTVLSVLTLALGVGGTAAVFGIARPLMFESLPFANTNELAVFWMGGSWNEQEFMFLRDKFPGFRSVASYRQGDVALKDGTAPMRLIRGLSTSGELFEVLGAKPLLGRTLRVGDDVQGVEPVVVLSYGLWQELGGDQSIIGKRFNLNGTLRTVAGVMPRGFWFPDPAVRIWVPQILNPQRQNGSFTLVGRVAPGADPGAMGPHLERLVATLGARFHYPPEWDKTKNALVTPIRTELLGSMRPALVATFTAMALILLIACVNVAAIMLGQVEGRASEMAVRTALGATRGRLTQQLIVEALILGVCAAICGGALAATGFRLLAQTLPIGAWGEAANFDWMLFGVALAIALAAALLVVLVPTISLWRGDLRGALNRARTGGIEGRGSRLEQGLVVVEVALAMLIASSAALLVRSVSNLYSVDPGIDTRGVAVIDTRASVDALGGTASSAEAQRQRDIDAVVAELRGIPGVRSAAAAMKLPLRGNGDTFGLTIDGRPDVTDANTFFRIVTADYFTTLGFRLKAGRTFTSSDGTATGEIPVLVNEELAKRFFPGVNPVGRAVSGGFNIRQRIIGVVANVAEGKLTDAPSPARYFYGAGGAWFGTNASFVVRTNPGTDPGTVLDAARRTVQRIAPNFAVYETTTMDRVMDRAVGPARQIMSLLALLSGLALVLGAIGIYGVISHFAARRKRDWAIRVALGLTGSRVVRHIVGQGATLAVAGIVIGAIGTVAVTRLLTSFLFGVSTVDPTAFAAASVALLIIALGAAFIPAWRAGRVDPARVLREQ